MFTLPVQPLSAMGKALLLKHCEKEGGFGKIDSSILTAIYYISLPKMSPPDYDLAKISIFLPDIVFI